MTSQVRDNIEIIAILVSQTIFTMFNDLSSLTVSNMCCNISVKIAQDSFSNNLLMQVAKKAIKIFFNDTLYLKCLAMKLKSWYKLSKNREKVENYNSKELCLELESINFIKNFKKWTFWVFKNDSLSQD